VQPMHELPFWRSYGLSCPWGAATALDNKLAVDYPTTGIHDAKYITLKTK
jgi:hypothetical protein